MSTNIRDWLFGCPNRVIQFALFEYGLETDLCSEPEMSRNGDECTRWKPRPPGNVLVRELGNPLMAEADKAQGKGWHERMEYGTEIIFGYPRN